MAQIDEVTVQLDELDTRLDRLRALYEQYFVGIEKIEPHVQKKDVERRVQTLRKMQLRNTAARFRFQGLVQKYTTYQTYWQRIVRQIEEGTFKRELARIQRYGKPSASVRSETPSEPPAAIAPEPSQPPVAAPPRERMVEEIPMVRFDSSPSLPAQSNSAPAPAQPPAPAPPAPAVRMPPAPPANAAARRVGLSPFGAPGSAPARPPKPPRRKSSGSMKAVRPPVAPNPATPPAPAAPPAKPADPSLHALYERYRDARRQNGEGDVSFDTVEKQVRDTLPQLAEKYPQHSVSLDVATQDGKTILRPVVRAKK
jgi:hypothetical protein